MASRAIEIRSPAESRMSISRSGAFGGELCGRIEEVVSRRPSRIHDDDLMTGAAAGDAACDSLHRLDIGDLTSLVLLHDQCHGSPFPPGAPRRRARFISSYGWHPTA